MRADTLHALIPVALFAGLLLSGYAAYETTHPAAQGACSFSSYFSCAKVDTSAHTTTLGIPDYVFGIVGFLGLIALDVPLYRTWERRWLQGLLALSFLGIVVSVYLLAIETFVIGAICPVCLSTYFANGIAFVAALALWWKSRPARKAAAATPAAGTPTSPKGATPGPDSD